MKNMTEKTAVTTVLFVCIICVSLVFSCGCVSSDSPKNKEGTQFIAISTMSGPVGESGLALRSDGKVVCWGSNYNGICDIPENLSEIKSISNINYAVKRDGTVVGWGSNRFYSEIPSNLSNVIEVTKAGNNMLALHEDGRITTWTSSEYSPPPPFYASSGKIVSDSQRAKIVNQSDLVSISGNFGLKKDGTVVTWYDFEKLSSPTIPNLSDVTAISNYGDQFVALKKDGSITALKIIAPRNPDGQFKTEENSVVQNLSDIAAISSGRGHGLALLRNGTVISWTDKSFQLLKYTDIAMVAAGSSFDLALKNDGSIIAWGDNSYGQLSTPSKFCNVTSISSGDYYYIARMSDGNITIWGNGLNALCCIHGHEPQEITNVTGIFADDYQIIILENNETIYGWGEREIGPFYVEKTPHRYLSLFHGNNTLIALNRDGNLNILTENLKKYNTSERLENVTEISSHWGIRTVAVKNDGTVRVWGGNTDIPQNLSGVISVSHGWSYILALKNDGTVVGWGDPTAGYLYDIPAGLSNVTAISAGQSHNLALKKDGTIVAWGNNKHGECNVPKNLHDVIAIKTGPFQSFALKKDGTVVAWGSMVIPDWNG